MSFTRLLSFALLLPFLSACTDRQMYDSAMVKPAQVTDRTRAGEILEALPRPSEKIAVATYDFQDQTGQFKYNDKYTDYSSAVTKGGNAILVNALLAAGNHGWFSVVERGGLKDLLQERQIIKVMRSEYTAPGGNRLPTLPPLLYGGMLLEGGIVSYDSNVVTGGVGATYLGIGATTQYHRDLVTVYLRAVNVQNGEVLLSVNSSKTIYSTSLDSNVLKYVTFDRLLQAEAGFSLNEPTQLGVRQAIETAVYSLIMEGAIDHLWSFRDPVAGQRAIDEYLMRRDGRRPAGSIETAQAVPVADVQEAPAAPPPQPAPVGAPPAAVPVGEVPPPPPTTPAQPAPAAAPPTVHYLKVSPYELRRRAQQETDPGTQGESPLTY